jgi:L-amino acid N-acyltransferase YncA
MNRDAHPDDAAAICKIYNHYVLNTTVTFEEEAVSPEAMAVRLEGVSINLPWLVHERDGRVVGYAHASAWKSRCAYRYSAETSVYLAPNSVGRGLGRSLYLDLIERLSQTDCHSLLAGIALPNDPSIALHEKLGFEKVGQFKEVGRKFDSWVDVGYWEKLLPHT